MHQHSGRRWQAPGEVAAREEAPCLTQHIVAISLQNDSVALP